MTPTGRLAVLALVLAVVVVALALPVRGFLAQRAEIAELTARKAAAEAAIAQLQETKRLWGDDAYVRTQARSRLHYVMPGESGYVVVTPEPEPTESRPVAPVGEVTTPVTPWFTTLWDSARAVDASQ
jgi:cell division protein FtsB